MTDKMSQKHPETDKQNVDVHTPKDNHKWEKALMITYQTNMK